MMQSTHYGKRSGENKNAISFEARMNELSARRKQLQFAVEVCGKRGAIRLTTAQELDRTRRRRLVRAYDRIRAARRAAEKRNRDLMNDIHACEIKLKDFEASPELRAAMAEVYIAAGKASPAEEAAERKARLMELRALDEAEAAFLAAAEEREKEMYKEIDIETQLNHRRVQVSETKARAAGRVAELEAQRVANAARDAAFVQAYEDEALHFVQETAAHLAAADAIKPQPNIPILKADNDRAYHNESTVSPREEAEQNITSLDIILNDDIKNRSGNPISPISASSIEYTQQQDDQGSTYDHTEIKTEKSSYSQSHAHPTNTIQNESEELSPTMVFSDDDSSEHALLSLSASNNDDSQNKKVDLDYSSLGTRLNSLASEINDSNEFDDD